MAFGMSVVNQDNHVQVDGFYSNLGLVATGTVYPATRFPQGTAVADYYGIVSVSGRNSPVIALRTAAGNAASITGVVDRGAGDFEFYVTSEIQGAPVDYYVFDLSDYSNAFPGRFGLLVNDQDGVRRFDSRLKTLRVVDFIHVEMLFQSETFYYPGKTVALIPVQCLSRVDTIFVRPPTNESFVISSISKISTPSNSQVNINFTQIWSQFRGSNSSNPIYTWNVDNGYFVVADVTGF